MKRLLSFLAIGVLIVTGTTAGAALAAGQSDTSGAGKAPEHSQAGGQGQAQGGNASSGGPGQQAQGQGTQRQSSTSSQGANQSGPYNPSGVGSPSGNGKSTDNNGNRPCAGCVGKADAKNPPGQLPGGQDSNRGYECDDNQGVGKTNPAHSGCSSGSTTTTTTSAGGSSSTGSGPAGQPGGPSDQGAVLGQSQPDRSEPPAADSPAAGEPEPAAGEPARGRELPFTGLGLVWMALLGLILVGVGRQVRRSSSPVPDEPARVTESAPEAEAGTPPPRSRHGAALATLVLLSIGVLLR